MKKRTALICVALSVISLVQLKFFGNSQELKSDSIHHAFYVTSSLARLSAVEIIIPNKGFGSGVIVNKKGNTYTVLTAWHLFDDLEPGSQFKIRTAHNETYKINQSSIKQIKNLDMAIFSLESGNNYEIAEFSDKMNLRRNDILFSSGFASGKFHLQKGKVIANAEVDIKEGEQLIYTNRIISGMSGGAIFDLNSNLVGINTMSNLSSFDDKQFAFSIGVPISYYIDFMNDDSSTFSSNLISLDDHLVKATEIITSKGDLEIVINILEKSFDLIDFDINDIATWYIYKNLCHVKNKLEDYIGAEKNCAEAITIAPNDIRSYLYLAISKSKMNDDYGAISAYNKILKVDSENSVVYTYRAISKRGIGDHQGSISDFTKAIKLAPNESSLFLNRGISKDYSGDHYGAISDFNNAIKIHPKHANYYRSRGITKMKIGDMKGACSDFRQASSLGAEDAAKWVRNQC